MKRIDQEILNDIRQKTDIVNVIGQYIPLQKSGQNYKGICPFHDDHDPSLSVNSKMQIYKCFVCQEGGNVFRFVQKFEKISFVEAVVKVAATVGIDLSEQLQFLPKLELDPKLQRKFDIMNESKIYYQYLLKNTLNTDVKEFLKERQISNEITETFEIGFSDPNLSLTDYLVSKGYRIDELINLNLTYEYDGNYKDVFSNRVVFPIADTNNRVIAYTARALQENTSKYINSASTDLYQKSDLLYNYYNARQNSLKDFELIVCEGVMDVISFYKGGFQKVVATLGTAFTNEQIQLIKRLNCSVILAYDGDTAGKKATYIIGKQLVKENIKVSVINNTTTLDPDDFLKKYGLEKFRQTINNPLHWVEFVINYASNLYSLNSYDSKKTVVEIVIEELSQLDQIDQDYFLQQLSALTGFEIGSLSNQIDSTLTKNVKSSHQKSSYRINTRKSDKNYLKTELMILAHLLESKHLANIFRLKLGYLLNDEINSLANTILSIYQDEDTIEVADLLTVQLSQSQQQLLLEITSNEIFHFEKNETTLTQSINLLKIEEINKSINYVKNEILNEKDESKRQLLVKSMVQLQLEKEFFNTEEANEKI